MADLSTEDMEPQRHGALDYNTYLSYRKVLVEGATEQGKSYEKQLLTLATGLLGASLIFLEKIAPNPASESMIYLYLSWGCLLFSIVSIVTSLLVSSRAFQRATEILDLEQAGKCKAGILKNNYSTIVVLLNISAGVSFFGGVLFLCVFAISNMK